MKKRKKQKTKPQLQKKQHFSFKQKFARIWNKPITKETLLVFTSVFLITLFITLHYKPLKTHEAPGDAFYYYKNAQAFSQVWKSPFYYIPRLLTHSLTKQELYNIGFNYQSDFDSFFRAPAYNTYLSLWIWLFGTSEIVALLSQIFLFALLMSLLFFFIRKKANRNFAIIIVSLSLLYLSYYIVILQTITELFQTFTYLLLTFYVHFLYSNNQKNSKKHYVLLALLTLLVIYSKMSNKFLWIILIPLFIFFEFLKSKTSKKQLKKNMAVFLISFFLSFLLSNWILSQGQTSASNLGGWRNYYAGSCTASSGFVINTLFHENNFRKNINKSHQKFWFNKYSEICKYAFFDIMKSHPVAFFNMTFKKISLLLSHPPSNNANMSFLKSPRHYLNYYHLLILILATLSFFFLGSQFFYIKSLFIIFLIYISALFGLSNPDTRYFLPLIPFYFFFLGLSINELIHHNIKIKKFISVLLILLIFLLLNKNILVSLFPSIFFIQFIKIIFLVGIIFLLLKFIFISKPNLQEKILNLVALIFILVLFIPLIIDYRGINHFPANSHNITQIITLNHIPEIKTIKCAFDIKGKGNAQISFNTWTTNVMLEKLNTYCNSNTKPPYQKDYYKPHWVFIPIKPQLLKKTNMIKITLHKAKIFYTLPSANKKHPSAFHFKNGIDSILYGPFSHQDPRVYMPIQLESTMRQTINKKQKKIDANIFIISKEQGHYYLPKKYEQLMNANIKYIALFNPLDRKLVFWSKTNPGEDFVVVHGNLYRYLAGELDRFYSGYHWY